MATTCCCLCKNYNTCLKYKKGAPLPNTHCCKGCDHYSESENAGKEWWCVAPKFFEINPRNCYEKK